MNDFAERLARSVLGLCIIQYCFVSSLPETTPLLTDITLCAQMYNTQQVFIITCFSVK